MRRKGSFKGQPGYRLHKGTGQAVVTLNGRDIYLGKWGATREEAPESWGRYDREIAEWLLRGRQPANTDKQTVTVEQVIAGYLQHVCHDTGRPARERVRSAMRWLRRTYGDAPAAEFSPAALKALRLKMTDGKCWGFGKELNRTLSRTYINILIAEIKRVFAWGTEVEMIPASVHFALHAVKPLRRNQTSVRETHAVRTIDEKHIEATINAASPILAAMIQFQLYTGARCGEVFQMRGCDIDMSNPRAWRYRPSSHKTQHHEKERVIFIGPKAQEVVRPFLKPDVQAVIFSPSDSLIRLQCKRLSDGKLHTFQQGLSARMRKRVTHAMFTGQSYWNSIKRACDRADRLAHERNPDVPAHARIVPRWHSHQLRHNAGTYLRKEFGLDVAQTVLGHSSAAMTEVYAEVDYTAAEAAIAKVG